MAVIGERRASPSRPTRAPPSRSCATPTSRCTARSRRARAASRSSTRALARGRRAAARAQDRAARGAALEQQFRARLPADRDDGRPRTCSPAWKRSSVGRIRPSACSPPRRGSFPSPKRATSSARSAAGCSSEALRPGRPPLPCPARSRGLPRRGQPLRRPAPPTPPRRRAPRCRMLAEQRPPPGSALPSSSSPSRR